jgi:hypothetical protein
VDQVKSFAKRTWRATRKHLPPKVAEGIRVPAKRALRKLGVISGGRSGN